LAKVNGFRAKGSDVCLIKEDGELAWYANTKEAIVSAFYIGDLNTTRERRRSR
jgi:hypothetical protein